jgi:hypothetical protein
MNYMPTFGTEEELTNAVFCDSGFYAHGFIPMFMQS